MKLTLDDISDLRAYEREREDFRRHIIELKLDRRVAVGPVISLTFENRETMRFQVQEMARAERMMSDEAIQRELDVYNALIPEAGQLSATLFLELTSESQLRRWLPALVGVERAVELVLGDTDDPSAQVVRCIPEEAHEAQLTREEVTASVHYIFWELTPAQVERFAAGPVVLQIDHPAYQEGTVLSEATRRSLLQDLRGA